MNGTDPPCSPRSADGWGNDMPWLGGKLKLAGADKLDASPTSTHYSSCGERLGHYDDSDLDRATGYASANSLGTPSLCSSFGTCNDFLDSEIGSVRSASFREDQNLEPLEHGYETEGSSRVRAFTIFGRKPNKRNVNRRRESVLDIGPKPATAGDGVGIGCPGKEVDVLPAERNESPALCVESENLLFSREATELKGSNNGTQQSSENEVSDNAGGGILIHGPHRALGLYNYVDPVRHKAIRQKSDSFEIRAMDCSNKEEHGQSDSLGCQTTHNLEGACRITEGSDLDQIRPPPMAGDRETKLVSSISGSCLSQNLGEFSSGHDQQVVGSGFDKELPVVTTHDLGMLSPSDKFSDWDNQSEFDSILEDVTDEEDAYVDPVRHKAIRQKSDSSEIRAMDCSNKKEHGQSETTHNLEGACRITGGTDLDQIRPPPMAGDQETKLVSSISESCLSQNLREFSSGHDQQVVGSAFDRELPVATTHNLEMLSPSDKFSDWDNQSEFDSILEDVTDEEDALLCTTMSPNGVDTGNPLHLNPEVVFGAGDWDDFVREVGENDLRATDLMQEVQKAHVSHAESGNIFLGTANTTKDMGVTSELSIEDPSNSLMGDVATHAFKNVLRTQLDQGSLCDSSGCGRPDLEEDDRQDFLRVMDYVQTSDAFHSNIKDARNSYAGAQIYTKGDVQIPSQLINHSTVFHLAEEEEEKRNLRLQKPHIEAFYAKSQDANRDIFLLQASHMNVQDTIFEKELECLSDKEEMTEKERNHLKYDEHSVRQASNETGPSSGPLPDVDAIYFPTMAAEICIDKTPIVERNSENVLQGISRLRNNFSCDTSPKAGTRDAKDWGKDDLGPDELSRYVETLDVNESYVDTVHDMEDVLLDSGESSGARFVHAKRGFSSQTSGDYRDEVSSASVTDVDNAHLHMQYFQKLNWIEVVGAKQIKGRVSFGERLVGVKEYTIYQIRVQSGINQWEIERRYSDFLGLYRQLKRLFAVESGAHLPSPWEHVERESRKVFGTASPDVIAERSALVQECLQSLVLAGSPFDSTPPLFWFLLPHRNFSDTPATLERHPPENIQVVSKEKGSCSGPIVNEYRHGDGENLSAFGKTIRLIVHTHPHKSMKQLLEAQHYSCAGCYRHLDVAKGLMQGVAQTFGWGKPRLCEYIGQLFCTSCHSNETAILPARVLQLWDFVPCPVSQLAKAYLDSIYDRPMLCVSAVNPFIFSKVPVLVHVMDMRKKLSKMIACIRCPFRTFIQRSLGSRRYLLESNDFFALRDLVDLSKGAFAALPSLMEIVSKKIYMHITQRCSICCEVGESCGARLKCEKPSSLIFLFQEGGVVRCESCQLVFHQSCFIKLGCCPCSGTNLSEDPRGKDGLCDESDVKPCLQSHPNVKSTNSSDPCLSKQGSTSSKGFFINLFQKGSLDSIWKPRKKPGVLNMASLSGSVGL